MLYQIGPATVSTFPFSIDALKRETAADWAAKDLLGRRRGREFMGEGDETLKLSGTIFPYNRQMPGAALILDILQGIRMAGLPVFVLRGDFAPLGWWILTKIEEQHEMIAATGVGQVIKHSFDLTRVSSLGFDAGYSILGTLVSLMGGDFGIGGGISGTGSSTGEVQDVWFSAISGALGSALTGSGLGGVAGSVLGSLAGGVFNSQGERLSDPQGLIAAAFDAP